MQEALPYKTWLPAPKNTPRDRSSSSTMNYFNSKPKTNSSSAMTGRFIGDLNNLVSENAVIGDLKKLVSENAVIVFGKRGCCMSHVVKRLLQGLGVNPAVYEINEEDEDGVVYELEMIGGGNQEKDRLQFPAVFIGGELFGGLDRIMATHITGELTPILKKAGALWL
ncbi:unnamed protein product [Ilex paraguariensis]|uniref:Glutaredoxin domain-containing protein n=1 Tax=Ilex paraguariensis TaxID=185542 RepID=A0ABC8THU0_9AQUA